MKIIYKKVNEGQEIIEIEHGLENMQELVGGLIDCLDIQNNITIVFDDEGKIKQKPVNMIITRGTWSDYIVGDIFFCGFNSDEGELISLTDQQIEYIMNMI